MKMTEVLINNLGNEWNTQRTVRFENGEYWIEITLHSSMHHIPEYARHKDWVIDDDCKGVCKNVFKKHKRIPITYRPAYWTINGHVPCNSGFCCQHCAEKYEDQFKHNSPCRSGEYVGNGGKYSKIEIIEYLREKGFLKPLPIYKPYAKT